MKHAIWAAGVALAFGASLARAAEPAGDGSVSEVVVTAARLDAARASIQPEIGASTYTAPKSFIQQLPGGDNAPLNQVILQMPGVAQDSYGQLHVRGDHADVQYRFNGVILPEGLSFFGQVLSPRIADQIRLITGALPAEYGLRTAGVLDIRTRSGFDSGGDVSVYGGSHGEWEPSVTYGGSSGSNSYFGSLSYLRDQLGIESVDGRSTPLHDGTSRLDGFGYFDRVLDASSRISVFGGGSYQTFQIPDPAGEEPSQGYQYDGQSAYPSARLNASQAEANLFAAASYLWTGERLTVQASVFGRYSRLDYHPDVLGELLYNGFEERAAKQDVAGGLQAEGVYRLGPRDTVRAGLLFEDDHGHSAETAQTFRTDAAGALLTDAAGNDLAQTVIDNASASARTISLYLQDAWKPSDAFVLNYGLRFDALESFRRENQLSPRVNFVWTPADGVTVHGGYARYFTPPPFELVAASSVQKYAGTVAFPTVTADATPYAERAHYFDLGVEGKPARGLTLGLDAYLRRSENLLDEGQFGAPIILTPFNYRSGRIEGVELTSNFERGPFAAYLNLAWSQAFGKDIETSQFNFSPAELAYIAGHFIYLDHNQTWSSSFGASWRWRDTRFAVDGLVGSGLRATVAGGAPNGVSLPAYVVANLALQQKVTLPGAGPLTLRFDVVNLFDAVYELRDGTGVGVGAPQWGARRGFFAGISKHF